MKTITEFLQKQHVEKKFSDDELKADYETLGDADMATKKEIAAKYGIDSRKADELKKGILEFIRINRRGKKEFTNEDVRWFSRLDIPEMYKKFAALASEETPEFIAFYKDFVYDNIVKKKLDKKIPFAKSRDFNYHMTYADKYLIMRYLNAEQFLKDTDPEEVKAKKETENFENMILVKLNEQSAEFKADFLGRARKYAENVYDNAPKNAEAAHKKYKELAEKRDARSEEVRKEHKVPWRDSEYNKLADEASKKYDEYRRYEAITKVSRKEHVDREVNDAEKTYNINMLALAHKINERGLNAPMLKVSHIDDDPKYFSLLVDDGTKKLYARSIIAAEWSEKVKTHFRFIITSRKDGTVDD